MSEIDEGKGGEATNLVKRPSMSTCALSNTDAKGTGAVLSTSTGGRAPTSVEKEKSAKAERV